MERRNRYKDLHPEYRDYDRQKCFVAHSLGAEWSEDLKRACESALPQFNPDPGTQRIASIPPNRCAIRDCGNIARPITLDCDFHPC